MDAVNHCLTPFWSPADVCVLLANLGVRYRRNGNDFLDACVRVIRCGFGMPAFNNDEIVIPEFIRIGDRTAGRLRLRDVRQYPETAVGEIEIYRCTGMSFY